MDNDKKPSNLSDHLANERTFLAWVRTSIALMGFGFVIVKFALFLKQITIAFREESLTPNKGYSAMIGVIMVALGAIILTLAYFRYKTIQRQLNTNTYSTSNWLITLVTIAILIGNILMVVYLLPNI